LGLIDFQGKRDTGALVSFVKIQALSQDITIGDDAGELRVQVAINNNAAQFLNLYGYKDGTGAQAVGGGAIVFNEDSFDVDFRVESDNNANALFVQGSSGNVGIGTTTPDFKLDVEGDIRATGNVYAENYIVSSSVTSMSFAQNSGSTIFGDSSDDIHQFTGSLNLTGSMEINSLANPLLSLNVTSGNSAIHFKNGGTTTGHIYVDGSKNMYLSTVDTNPAIYLKADGKIGIGTADPDRRMHVHNASAGSVTAVSYTELVVEDDGGSGISILSPDANSGNIVFGSPSDNDYGQIRAYYNSGSPRIAIELSASEKFNFIGR
jgi:hypothetical protein